MPNIIPSAASCTPQTAHFRSYKLVARGAVVAQIDVDAAKLGYQMPVHYAVQGDAKATAEAVSTELGQRGMTSPRPGRRTDAVSCAYPLRRQSAQPLSR